MVERLAELQMLLNFSVPFGQPTSADLAGMRTQLRQPFVEKPVPGQKV